MSHVVFAGQIDPEKSISIPLTLAFAEQKPIECVGIIDTGSQLCIANVGVLNEEWFGASPEQIHIRDASGSGFNCRGVEMRVRFERNGMEASFNIPFYELPIRVTQPGTRILLLGRPLLKCGLFVYDGVNGTWSLTFPATRPNEISETIVTEV